MSEQSIQVVAPAWLGMMLFHDGDALSKPARDSMIRGLQRHHMSELVPERAAPIERPLGARAGRVHHHAATEADSERSEAGYSHRPDSEVFMVGKHFKVDWLRWGEFILF